MTFNILLTIPIDTIPTCEYISIVLLMHLQFRFDEWDNRFFGISDGEAETVDPQQHFVLETVHMALEDGGITREKLSGSDTGVYIGRITRFFIDFVILVSDRMTN
jgi:3-oxoacyl-(acyl-carrier-protein) synthase